MTVYDVVRTALAVRQYEDKPIPPETLKRIVEAARLTGNSMNQQPWSFIVIQDRKMLEKLGGMVQYGPYIAQASAAVAVVIERTPFAVSDGSRAIQSMVLTAWDEGIGSNWVGFMGPEAVKPVLGIPDDRDLLAIVPFGYPDQATGKGSKNRKPVDQVVFYEQFGQSSQ